MLCWDPKRKSSTSCQGTSAWSKWRWVPATFGSGKCKTAWEGWYPSNHLSTYLICWSFVLDQFVNHHCHLPVDESIDPFANFMMISVDPGMKGLQPRHCNFILNFLFLQYWVKKDLESCSWQPEISVFGSVSQQLSKRLENNHFIIQLLKLWSCLRINSGCYCSGIAKWCCSSARTCQAVGACEWHCPYRKSKAKKVMVNCESMTKWPPSESKDIQNPLCRIKETKAAHSFWTELMSTSQPMTCGLKKVH